LLRTTIADGRLSGGERDALKKALNEAPVDDARRALLRHNAFSMAQEALATHDGPRILEWVESVTKLLLPPADRAASMVEALFTPHDDCPGRIIRQFAEVRAQADLCVFTITDDRISDAILASHARGIKLRIVSDNDKAHDLGSDIERFAAAGVPVRLDRTPFHMHHKFAIFDTRRLLHGSFNWTRGAARDNQENIVVTDDPRLIAAFGREFERLWAQYEC
jgi:phosphatidylserine/phosphatidylglycerophosphate/cardiolipin synthase-like enzyme